MAEHERGYCDGCGQAAGGFTEHFGMMLCDLCIADESDEYHAHMRRRRVRLPTGRTLGGE